MSDKINIIRVFIGSPGGLSDERQAAHEVVNEINLSNSDHWGCQLKLIGWEDTIPGFHRPQDKINEDLDKCDYFLGVLWNRWGSRPSTDESEYTSGFHEEFCRARQRIESGHMKDLVIYFKNVEVPDGMEPGEHIKKVLEFRQQCIDEKKVFFKDFESIENFRDLVRSKLTAIGWQEADIKLNENKRKNQSEQASLPPEQPEDSDPEKSLLIDRKAREFLQEILTRPPEWDKTKPHEIARFRLISSALARSGNDEFYIGNHDANLIFHHLRNSPLSKPEIKALIDCGTVGFHYQNVPLWRWLAKATQDDNFFSRIKILAVFGNTQEQKNALQILDYASHPIPTLNEFLGKKEVLNLLLTDEIDSQTFDAIILFISNNAERDDISLLEEASSNCSPERRMRVEAAIIGILSRSSIDSALKRLVEKEVDKLEDGVVDTLFKSPQSLVTETITLCLSSKSDDVRLRAVQLLFERNEISLEASKSLITDNNHKIRLIAAENLKKLNQELESDVLKKALTIEKQGWGLRLISQGKEIDNTHYESYLSNRLAELDLPTLRKKVDEAGVFSIREHAVMYSKFRTKTQDEIRNNLQDWFMGHLMSAIKKEEDAGNFDFQMVSRIKKLNLFIRNQLGSHALTVLCNMAQSKDLSLVRKTIDAFEVDGSSDILKYIIRFGDWSDIERIKKLDNHPQEQVSLLSIPVTQIPKEKASAILALSKGRIADMLELELEPSIRKSLAKQLPKKVIIELSDEILLRELNRGNDDYRSILALKCVLSLSKKRISSLLDKYTDTNQQRYYNSVHWLDLGASLPHQLAKTIAERKLSRM